MLIRVQNICLLILVFCLISACNKQADIGPEQADGFVKYFGGSPSDNANALIPCSGGGYAITGSMVSSGGISQAYFIKTDKYGNSTTTLPLMLGNGYLSSGNSLCQTSDGGFLVVGYTIPVGRTDKNILLVKLSANGTIVWTNTIYGGSKNDEAFSVTEILPDSTILVGGYTESYGNGGKDAWVLLLHKDGSEKWDKTYGFSGDEVCNSVILKNNYFLLTGYTNSYNYLSFKKNVFLVKIDKTSGNSFDSEYYGGVNDETGVKSIVDSDGNIYVLGNSVTNNSSNIYMLKLSDNIHQVIWEKYLNSTSNNIGNDILLSNSNIVIVGSSTTNQNSDFLINLLDNNGQLLNGGKNILSAQGDQSAQACTIGSDGKIVFAGSNSVFGFSKIALIKNDIPK